MEVVLAYYGGIHLVHYETLLFCHLVISRFCFSVANTYCLQESLNVVLGFVNQVGLKVCAEKSTFVVTETALAKTWTAQEGICLRIDEVYIAQCS